MKKARNSCSLWILQDGVVRLQAFLQALQEFQQAATGKALSTGIYRYFYRNYRYFYRNLQAFLQAATGRHLLQESTGIFYRNYRQFYRNLQVFLQELQEFVSTGIFEHFYRNAIIRVADRLSILWDRGSIPSAAAIFPPPFFQRSRFDSASEAK